MSPEGLIGLSGHRFLNSASQAARAIAASTTAATSSATGSGAGFREGLPAGPLAGEGPLSAGAGAWLGGRDAGL